jgi:hypothetical protein
MAAYQRFGQKTLRSLVAAASATFLTGFNVLGVSMLAFATAEGCTSAPQGYICNKTRGDKARVDSIYVIRTRVKGKPRLVCDYSADASVLAPGGRVKWFSHQKHVGCTPVRAFFKFNRPLA